MRAADKLELMIQAYEYEKIGYRTLDKFWTNSWNRQGVKPFAHIQEIIESPSGAKERGLRHMRGKGKVMTAEDVRRALIRISHEILERNHRELGNLVLIGIKSRGDHLALRIAKNLEEIEGIKVPVGAIDVYLYRDDVNLYDQDVKVNHTDILSISPANESFWSMRSFIRGARYARRWMP